MKRLLVLLVLVVVTACYGQEGSEGAGGYTPATGEAPPTADTLEVTPDTIMARDTAVAQLDSADVAIEIGETSAVGTRGEPEDFLLAV